jgi:hypothetical protein
MAESGVDFRDCAWSRSSVKFSAQRVKELIAPDISNKLGTSLLIFFPNLLGDVREN